jgi:hypothetical protein
MMEEWSRASGASEWRCRAGLGERLGDRHGALHRIAAGWADSSRLHIARTGLHESNLREDDDRARKLALSEVPEQPPYLPPSAPRRVAGNSAMWRVH